MLILRICFGLMVDGAMTSGADVTGVITGTGTGRMARGATRGAMGRSVVAVGTLVVGVAPAYAFEYELDQRFRPSKLFVARFT